MSCQKCENSGILFACDYSTEDCPQKCILFEERGAHYAEWWAGVQWVETRFDGEIAALCEERGIIDEDGEQVIVYCDCQEGKEKMAQAIPKRMICERCGTPKGNECKVCGGK